ncbi:c-type cytochrome [Maritalea sp.]|uniref:c-type cytochrome n=1 Tax=Maritalea sp. TaxID=2003361 RepID=UPI003EF5A045
MNNKLAVLIGVAIIVSGVVFFANSMQDTPETKAPTSLPAGFIVPDLIAEQIVGQQSFEQFCQACHGDYGLGTNSGPPFIHRIYEPNHHGDGAFFNAAINGVRAHHWKFGNMPPVDDIVETDIGPIVAYIRALQKANGVF